jgi:tRNA U34 5-carboxymethylaminomethyl modifying GTPase MnmE/TrmE
MFACSTCAAIVRRVSTYVCSQAVLTIADEQEQTAAELHARQATSNTRRQRLLAESVTELASTQRELARRQSHHAATATQVEEATTQLREATGVTSPTELLQKYLGHAQTRRRLQVKYE